MPRVKANGIEIAYDLSGPPGCAVLFIDGHPLDRSMWRGQVDYVAKLGWQAVAPDLRGYGASTVIPGKTPLATFAGDATALLDKLGIVSAVVVGLSMGGQVAMEIVRLFPGRVRGLVLGATTPQEEMADARLHRSEMALRMTQDGMERYAEELLPKMLGAATRAERPHVAEHVLAMMRAAPPLGAAAAMRGRAERQGYSATLQRFDRPALIVAGDADAFTTRRDADRMHALLKRSELVWLKGVGHMPNLEQPDRFNRALGRFLERLMTKFPNEPKPPQAAPVVRPASP